MAEPFASAAVEPPERPEDVARRDFGVVRRGYDQMQVRAYLSAVASALRMAHSREAELRSRLATAVKRAHEAEKLDEATLTRRLGDETVRVLDTAREAAASIMANAEDRASTIVSTAEERAERITEAADGLMAERTAEAELAAEKIRARADEVLADAERRADELVEAGRREGEDLIAEARLAREHILRDMDRRRRTARAQIERMRAGRDKLLGSFDVVQGALDEATGSLEASLREAKIAADAAARRVADSREPGAIELEAEIEAAKLAGLIPAEGEATVDDAELPVAAPADESGGDAPADDVPVDEVDGDAPADDVPAEDPAEPDPDPEPATGSAEHGDDEDAEVEVRAASDGEPDVAATSDEVTSTGSDRAAQPSAADARQRYESRVVQLDPHRRGGRKLKKPPVEPSQLSPGDLTTVAVGDPDAEAVHVVPVAETDDDGQADEAAETAEGVTPDESSPDEAAETAEDVTPDESPPDEAAETAEGVTSDESPPDEAAETAEGVTPDESSPDEAAETAEGVTPDESPPDDDEAAGSLSAGEDSADGGGEVESDDGGRVVESVAGSDGEPESSDDATDGGDRNVDDLFARIRADRERSVSDARRKLAEAPPEQSGDGSSDATVEAPEAGLDVAARVEEVERRLKRALAEDQNRVLSEVGRDRGRKAPVLEIGELLAPLDEQLGQYTASILAHVVDGPLTPAAEERLGAVVRRDLVEPVRELVEACLDGDTEQITAEVRLRFRAARNEWIPPLAERLVSRADELAGLDATD